MTESPTHSSPTTNTTPSTPTPEIPIEIITDEEMASIEAALDSATRSIVSLTQFSRNTRSIMSITTLSKRRISSCGKTGSDSVVDIEDSANCRAGGGESTRKKRNKVNESFYNRFRRRRGLAVTHVTGVEWCEKQMEFFLLLSRPKANQAMKVGSARHAALEEEVIKKVKVHVESVEDVWAVKFINFIVGVNQLLFDGMTRELPLVSFEAGVWMTGVIDEIRIPAMEMEKYATLVETKTREQAKLPSEPQRRNGRLQLMCYKRLWDNLMADKFPTGKFFDYFSLNPNYILTTEIRENTAKSGFPAETLNDLVRYFRNSCCMLPPAHDQLLLRYELQEDQSLLGEDQFTYDADWLNSKLKCCLEFWLGEREPSYTPEEERWKCKFCRFSSVCPANANLEVSSSSREETVA